MSLKWDSFSGGAYPNVDPVHAGVDSDGQVIYVARAKYDDAIVPGKLPVGHSAVYIPYAGTEIPVENNYQVLVAPQASLSWVEARRGDVPNNAIAAGQDKDGEVLYIGRVIYSGAVTTGKVKRSDKVCYFAYAGKELNSDVYEVLVINAYGTLLGLSPELVPY